MRHEPVDPRATRHLDRRHDRLAARNSTRAGIQRWRARQEKDETSRDIGIASLPLRACRPSGGFVLGTLSVACWSSNDCWKANFGQMWTTVWKRCAPLPAGLWTTLTRCPNLRVSCVETCWTGGLIYFVWLFMSQSQGLIQILRRGRLSPTVQVSS